MGFSSAFPSAVISLSLRIGTVRVRMFCIKAAVPSVRTPCGEKALFPPVCQAAM